MLIPWFITKTMKSKTSLCSPKVIIIKYREKDRYHLYYWNNKFSGINSQFIKRYLAYFVIIVYLWCFHRAHAREREREREIFTSSIYWSILLERVKFTIKLSWTSRNCKILNFVTRLIICKFSKSQFTQLISWLIREISISLIRLIVIFSL